MKSNIRGEANICLNSRMKIILVSNRGGKGVVESLNLAYDFVKIEEEKGEVL